MHAVEEFPLSFLILQHERQHHSPQMSAAKSLCCGALTWPLTAYVFSPFSAKLAQARLAAACTGQLRWVLLATLAPTSC